MYVWVLEVMNHDGELVDCDDCVCLTFTLPFRPGRK